ncbi:hypothetical protein [Nocardia sp. 852002-51244_SCH5132740]|uniref:hypothetical protein n=1 Tax=Nocardia sp. 852002-51244_SCH5132740 TaxID=1834099 RepID=UPI0007EC13EF|nr:hypothetical protein [Nocardia sp. 852002-51244_SCH5132740]OBB34532.1 hypothetical protein A5748_06540 [Nocardia sp. 852002-51244_SCH5132740]
MQSRQVQFATLIDDLRRLGDRPDPDAIAPLEDRLKQLDHELRSVTDKFERYDLGKLSQEAHTRLSAAHQRSMIALDIAEAAHERTLHDALHPNILSPQMPEREELWDGFDR